MYKKSQNWFWNVRSIHSICPLRTFKVLLFLIIIYAHSYLNWINIFLKRDLIFHIILTYLLHLYYTMFTTKQLKTFFFRQLQIFFLLERKIMFKVKSLLYIWCRWTLSIFFSSSPLLYNGEINEILYNLLPGDGYKRENFTCVFSVGCILCTNGFEWRKWILFLSSRYKKQTVQSLPPENECKISKMCFFNWTKMSFYNCCNILH